MADAVADFYRSRHADSAQDLGEEAFFPGGVDEAAGSEGCGVQGAEAGCGDDQGEGEGADRAEDYGAEVHGDGGGGGDRGGREDEDVGYVGQYVGDDYEGHGGVDDAGEGFGWVEEFASHVVCLIYAPISADSERKTSSWPIECKVEAEKERERMEECKENSLIAHEGSEPRTLSHPSKAHNPA